MIQLQPHKGGVVLPVKAQPGARKSELRGEQDGMLKVAVTQIAEKGKANKALIAVMSKGLKLRKSQIELISGPTSSQKRFLIHGETVATLQDRIKQVLDSA